MVRKNLYKYYLFNFVHILNQIATLKQKKSTFHTWKYNITITTKNFVINVTIA